MVVTRKQATPTMLQQQHLCCDDHLQIHVNRDHTFFVNQEIISRFSGKLRKIVDQEKKKKMKMITIEIEDVPGGSDGFEMVSRFCYNNGSIRTTVSNVSLLHCCAIFLEMTSHQEDEEEERLIHKPPPTCNLLQQTEIFLEGMFYWSWSDILVCLKSCEPFFSSADSSGLVHKLMSSLLGKIDPSFDSTSSPSSYSSSCCSSSSSSSSSVSKNRAWWFDDLTHLSPIVIDKFCQYLKTQNNTLLLLTRFLIHYLKSALLHRKGKHCNSYGVLADATANGVVSIMGSNPSRFSCRGLFWVLRVVGCFGVSREMRHGLERLIGGMLHQATLDDLLVPSSSSSTTTSTVYDVSLVLRLIRCYVSSHHGVQDGDDDKSVQQQKMKKKLLLLVKVGRVVDGYLREIAPDHNLKVSKFLGIAESLPDFARSSFDGVYRAIDIYLECHPGLSMEERSRICRCINYRKLSLETCRELARNPKIPPRITIEALASQVGSSSSSSSAAISSGEYDDDQSGRRSSKSGGRGRRSNAAAVLLVQPVMEEMVPATKIKGQGFEEENSSRLLLLSHEEEEEEEEEELMMRSNLEIMQSRVIKLEKVCRNMKCQMSMITTSSASPASITPPTLLSTLFC